MRRFLVSAGAFLFSLLAGCGGSSGAGGVGGAPPQEIPALSAIAPSDATAGTSSLNLVVYGSNFENGATVQWNSTALPSSWVSATELTATVPGNDLASAGTANVAVANPAPGGGTSSPQIFTISSAPAASTLVKSVVGVATPQDVVWDAAHGQLYVSIASSDSVAPNTIVPVNPVTGAAGVPVQGGNNPDLLSISSDSSYLWAGIDGSNAVQRFLLPGLTKDISFLLPPNPSGNPQQAVCLQAAPNSPHTVAVIAGNWTLSPPGDGVYVYDDATARPTSVKAYASGGPMIDWFQWGASNSVLYGNQYTTIDAGGVATMNVSSTGVSFVSYNGGEVGPPYISQYLAANNLLYSLLGIFNPTNGSLVGTFNSPLFPLGEDACTADPSTSRYYCVVAAPDDPSFFELWVWDLNTAALINRVDFGTTEGQFPPSITGQPTHLVRWGNAGLALTTITAPYLGSGGVFLIDGPAVNPNSAPDYTSGAGTPSYSWMTSLVPQQAPANSGDVSVTINGANFAADSVACWNCDPSNFLPTTYVSPTQLNVTIPASLTATSGPLPIRVFDQATNLLSTDTLIFTVSSVSTGGPQVAALNLAGLAMAWDSQSGLIYVGVANYDGAYPNSIIAINGASGSVTQSQTVTADPYLLSASTDGQYLYVGFLTATVVAQLQLPGLNSPLTWTLSNPQSSAVYTAGDIRAAPMSPNTTAVTLWNLESMPDETGGVVIYDDNVERPTFVPGVPDEPVDTLAWSSSDQVLTGALTIGALDEFQINPSGATFVSAGAASFNNGEIHSDFGTGLIYSDDGNVANPTTQAVVGTYNASGLVAPDSSLNRVFILGQTQAQTNTSNFTIESFDENAYTPVSSITLDDLQGIPTQIIRWGTSGLAVLTVDPTFTTPGMLYLIQDANFVSNAQSVASASKPHELVQCRWKRISKSDIARMLRKGTELP